MFVVNYSKRERIMETTLELPLEIAATSPQSLRERPAATLVALDSFMEQDEGKHQKTLRVSERERWGACLQRPL